MPREKFSELRANLSSGLSVWDRLHGTVGPQLPQQTLVMGLPPGPESCA